MRLLDKIALVSFALLSTSGIAQARHARAALQPGAILHFETRLSVGREAIAAALAAQDDPLSRIKGLHLYLQSGRVLSPNEVRLSSPYCRVEVDLRRAGAARDDSSNKVFLSSDKLTIASGPLRGDPHDYGDGEPLAGEDRNRLLESHWQRFGEGRNAQQGRAIEVRFRDEDDARVTALICFKKGGDYPDEEDVARALGALASIEPGDPDAEARQQAEERARREAESLQKTVGESAPATVKDNKEDSAEHRDRLKEYQESLKARRGPKREHSDLDDAVTATPNNAPAQETNGASSLGGIDWGAEMAKAEASKKNEPHGKHARSNRKAVQ